MHLGTLIIVVLSLLCQLTAAVLAVRLNRVAGTGRAWSLMAVAMVLAAIRRSIALAGLVLEGPAATMPSDFWGELTGLAISVFLLAGIAGIGPLLRAIRRSEAALKAARDDLERQVQARTAELLQANAALREEIGRREQAQQVIAGEQQRLRRLLDMYEHDRRLTAFDIHDGFVQQATAAMMSLEAYRAMENRQSPAARAALEQGLQCLSSGIAEARRLIGGLRPTILDESGLVPAVEQLVREARARSGAAIAWSHRVAAERWAPPLETALFRIIQESLANALRHGKTDQVSIELVQDADRLLLTVQDQGCGFDPQAVKADRLGLEGIRQRAGLLGGRAEIRSSPGRGTCVSVELPLEKVSEKVSETSSSDTVSGKMSGTTSMRFAKPTSLRSHQTG
ncbi:MAG: sensor histidine kinase [Thermoguttaceae bacterium]|jgi:signal transduction histidine kinase